MPICKGAFTFIGFQRLSKRARLKSKLPKTRVFVERVHVHDLARIRVWLCHRGAVRSYRLGNLHSFPPAVFSRSRKFRYFFSQITLLNGIKRNMKTWIYLVICMKGVPFMVQLDKATAPVNRVPPRLGQIGAIAAGKNATDWNRSMYERQVKRQCNELYKGVSRLTKRAQKGWMTEAEKKHKANELATGYMSLASKAGKLSNRRAANYVESNCLLVAAELKKLALTAQPTKRTTHKPRKSPYIQNKMISSKGRGN